MYRDVMDSTVPPQSYPFNSNDAASNDLSRRSSKKRRLGDRTADHNSDQLENWNNTQQRYAPNIHSSSISMPKYSLGAHNLSYASPEPIPTSAAVNLPQSAQWDQSTPYPIHDVNTFPTVTAFSQPYYHQDEVESTSYAPSWPPITHTQPSYELAGSIYPQADLESLQYGFGEPANFASASIQDQINSLPVRPPGMTDSPLDLSFNHDQAHVQRHLHDLPTLESLAIQVTHAAIKSHHSNVHNLSNENDDSSDFIRTFQNLRFNFEQTRRLFDRGTQESPFIVTLPTSKFDAGHQDILRKANIATFILAILDTSIVNLAKLHEHFIPVFVPFQQKLLKWQGLLLLELKTQAYIATLRQGQIDRSLDEYFPTYADGPLLARHPETPTLFPSERDFVDRCMARKQYLIDERQSASVAELSAKYPWTDFVREFVGAIGSNINGLLSLSTREHRSQHSADLRRRAHSGVMNSPQNLTANPPGSTSSDANNGVFRTSSHGSNTGLDSRKAGSSGATVRQPWTKPEEEALLEGLERVNGPHWSQILALYGRGGSINEVLKDRNQVQLKDKARNLKLWHLKLGREVPNNLKGVTGELRKRGGARARAALEAEERNARLERGASDGLEGDGIDPRLNATDALTSQTSRI